jgi:hypothetical protein
MSFLVPGALALLALAAPIVILYMLKLRRREVQVSSTLLWSLLLRDREANAPWQRLKRNLLLFLQLLLLLLLVLALARPFLPVPTVASGTIALLLDGSASMNAADLTPTRFAVAQAAARKIVEDMPAGSQATVILVTDQPQTLINASGRKDELLRAIDQARPGATAADWASAVALASGAISAGSAERSTIVFISDGGLPGDLPPLPGEVRYIPVGRSGDNLAVSALSLRPAGSGPVLFASVSNHGAEDREAILSISLDGELYNAQTVRVPAGGSADVVLSGLPREPAVYQASLSLPATAAAGQTLDALPLDDTAWAVYAPPTSGRVLLVSAGNIFLEQALAALPGLQPFRAPADAPLPADPFDLYIFDGLPVGQLPPQDVLIINPAPPEGETDPANLPWLEVGGHFTATTGIRLAEDPLLRFVDFSDVHILRARSAQVPDWARALMTAEGGPLLFAGETGGRRVAVLTFDLHDSDLPLQIAFPILIANLIDWLSPAQVLSAPDGLRPGETITIRPPAGATAVVIQSPSGAAFGARPGERGVLFANTRELGPYVVTVSAGEQVLSVSRFAVNLFDPGESDIQPQETITVGRSPVGAAEQNEIGQLEFWPWLAAVALGVLLVEWWVFHRGSRLRAPGGPRRGRQAPRQPAEAVGDAPTG